MSNVIQFGYDVTKPLTPQQRLFMARLIRREAEHKLLSPGERALVHRLLDEVEAEVAPLC